MPWKKCLMAYADSEGPDQTGMAYADSEGPDQTAHAQSDQNIRCPLTEYNDVYSEDHDQNVWFRWQIRGFTDRTHPKDTFYHGAVIVFFVVFFFFFFFFFVVFFFFFFRKKTEIGGTKRRCITLTSTHETFCSRACTHLNKINWGLLGKFELWTPRSVYASLVWQPLLFVFLLLCNTWWFCKQTTNRGHAPVQSRSCSDCADMHADLDLTARLCPKSVFFLFYFIFILFFF